MDVEQEAEMLNTSNPGSPLHLERDNPLRYHSGHL